MRGKIRNIWKACQPFDFSKCRFDRGITPTNIDFSVDLSPTAFLVGEFKNVGAPIPKGQKMHLERVADSHIRGGAECFVFIAEHSTPEMQEIIADEAVVVEWYWKGKWANCSRETTVFDICQWFSERHEVGMPAV